MSRPAIEPHCRIGKIRPHSGGADVRVIDQSAMRKPESEHLRRELVEKAQFFFDEWPDLAGFAIVAWNTNGFWSTAFRVGITSPYPAVAIPSLACDMLREDNTVNAAVNWINSQMQRGGPGAS